LAHKNQQGVIAKQRQAAVTPLTGNKSPEEAYHLLFE
jgi:hypothetical protein